MFDVSKLACVHVSWLLKFFVIYIVTEYVVNRYSVGSALSVSHAYYYTLPFYRLRLVTIATRDNNTVSIITVIDVDVDVAE